MKKFMKKIAIGLTAMMMTFSLAACGDKKEETTAAGSQDAAGGQIVFGTNAEFPPFEYVGGEGVVDGFDGIDMAIAKKIEPPLPSILNNKRATRPNITPPPVCKL